MLIIYVARPSIDLMLLGASEDFSLEKKAKSLGNAFIESQFNYPLLIWAFRRKTFYSKNGKNRYKTSKAVNAIDDS